MSRRRLRGRAVSLVPVRSPWQVRTRSIWLWVLEPWRSFGVIVALVGAMALPTTVLAAGSMFEVSAADAITQRVILDLSPESAGLYLSGVGRLERSLVGPLIEQGEASIAAIGALGETRRILVTDPAGVGPETASSDEQVEPVIGARGRLFSTAGAIDAIDVLEGSKATPGVWVSSTYAASSGFEVGDRIQLVGTSTAVPVAGIYADLWSGERSEFWQDIPSVYVPRFQRIFGQPDFELLIVDDSTLLDIAPIGRVAWHTPLRTVPASYASLVATTERYRELERSFTGSGSIGEIYRAFASDPGTPPSFLTGLPGGLEDVDRVVAGIEQPVRSATIGGTAAGVGLSILGAMFLVRRKESEYRLLASDGDGPLRFFGMAVGQFLAPAVLGVGLGLGVATLLTALLGPSHRVVATAMPWSWIIAATGLAVVLGGALTAMVATTLADGPRRPSRQLGSTWLVLSVGLTIAMWIQVGEATPGSTNALVVAFPLLGVVTGVLVVVEVLRLLMRRFRRVGSRLPLPLFLAWRSLGASDAGALLLSTALGVATGLAVLSSVLVASIDQAIEAKTETLVGGRNRVDLDGRIDAELLPDGATLVHTTNVNADGRRVTIVAIDPATFADGVTWNDAFGSTPTEVSGALDTPPTDALSAYLIGDDRFPETGDFGLNTRYPFRVIGRLASAPLAANDRTTLLINAEQLEAFAFDRFEQAVDAGLVDENEMPDVLRGYRRSVVSQLPLDRILAALDDAGASYRSVSTLDNELNKVESQSTRWAFAFLRIIATIGAIVGMGSLSLYLAERRRQRQVAAVMTARIGVSTRTNLMAAAAELIGLVVLSLLAGTTAAVLSARRIFPVFEPLPETPPRFGLALDLAPSLAAMAALLIATGVIAAAAQGFSGAKNAAGVLRG